MSNSIVAKIPKNLLFRYRFPCRHFEPSSGGNLDLPETHQLPRMGAFEDQANFADVRVGWRRDGIFVSATISGKQQSLWCRDTQLLDSDGIQIWIDTRDTHNVHRATKFCHWFILSPMGGGDRNQSPTGNMLKINRSREDSPTINRFKIDVHSKIHKDGYQLNAFIPDKCLNGWNTDDQRILGFNYAVVDREFGWQTLAIGPELPITEDPSLWQSLQLID